MTEWACYLHCNNKTTTMKIACILLRCGGVLLFFITSITEIKIVPHVDRKKIAKVLLYPSSYCTDIFSIWQPTEHLLTRYPRLGPTVVSVVRITNCCILDDDWRLRILLKTPVHPLVTPAHPLLFLVHLLMIPACHS